MDRDGRTDRSPEMDRAFSLDNVAGLDALFARRAAAAEAALAGFTVERGVAYGDGPQERLNIFPARERDAAVMIFIHGGFWRSLDADLFSFLAPGFVPAGAALVVIDYPLMPAARMADLVAACGRAVAWVADHARAFGGDPGRLFVSGNSAGGHLVAEVMDGPDGAALRGGTAISGIYDIEPVTRSFQNDDLCLTAAELVRFSPLCRTLDLRAPLLVAVGEAETGEFHRQAHAFAARCRTEALVVPGTDHITILLDGLAMPDNILNRAVRKQMGLPV